MDINRSLHLYLSVCVSSFTTMGVKDTYVSYVWLPIWMGIIVAIIATSTSDTHSHPWGRRRISMIVGT